MNEDSIQIRPYRASTDENFVYDTWLKSYRLSSNFARDIDREAFMGRDPDLGPGHHGIVAGILARSTTSVLMACDPDAEDSLYGYFVYEVHPEIKRPIAHYIYVKQEFRRFGVATRLITESKIDPTHCIVTHLTRDGYDRRADSPYFGMMRWPGAETLLKKWPLRWRESKREADGHRVETVHDGNLYLPYYV